MANLTRGWRWRTWRVVVSWLVLCSIVLGVPASVGGRGVTASPPQRPLLGKGNQGELGSRAEGAYLQYEITGVEMDSVTQVEDGIVCTGRVTAPVIRLKGLIYVALGEGRKATGLGVSAFLGWRRTGTVELRDPQEVDQEFSPVSPQKLITGPWSREVPFDFTLDLTGNADKSIEVLFDADISHCGIQGGVFEGEEAARVRENPPRCYWQVTGMASRGVVQTPAGMATQAATRTVILTRTVALVSTPVPPTEEPEVPSWIVVVGIGTAVVAAAAAAVVAIRRKQKGDKKQGKRDQAGRPTYILQVSKREVQISPGQTTLLSLHAWRVGAEGGYAPAPEAAIELSLAPQIAGLRVEPAIGMGALECALSLSAPVAPRQLTLLATARAAGAETSTNVVVTILAPHQIEIVGQNRSNQVKPGAQGLWVYARALVTPEDPRLPNAQLTASITFSLQGPNSGRLRLPDPPKGSFSQGYQCIQVFADPPVPGVAYQSGNPVIRAAYQVGQTVIEGSLPLVIQDDLQLGAWVRSAKQADVFFRSGDAPGWAFPEVACYLHNPGEPDKPISPGFKAQFAIMPSSESESPVLEIVEVQEYATDQYSLRIKLKDGVDLEQHFGPDLAEKEGIIRLKVVATDDQGRTYADTVALQLRPRLELVAHAWPEPMLHLYRHYILKGTEFVADGEDELTIVAACCRADKVGQRQVGQVTLSQVNYRLTPSLVGSAAPEYALQDKGINKEGARELAIAPGKPLLQTPKRAKGKLTLRLVVQLGPNPPPNYVRQPLTLDLELAPRYPDLHLWVVPGKERGTSEAWALLFLAGDARQVLTDTHLQLAVINHSGDAQPDLAVESPLEKISLSRAALTIREGDERAAEMDGSAAWVLAYEGLNWSNHREARFGVQCAIKSPKGLLSEARMVLVEIGRNVRTLLGDLYEAREGLKLNNPCFTPEGMVGKVAHYFKLCTWRPFLRGPVWNLSGATVGVDEDSERGYRTYVCSEMRDRISAWLRRRRHYQAGMPDPDRTIEKMATMNGIEFDHFNIPPIHVWEALFLSGMQPMRDARGLDPWWHQHWNNEAYKSPQGLISLAWEKYYAAEMAFWVAPAAATLLPISPVLLVAKKRSTGRIAAATTIGGVVVGVGLAAALGAIAVPTAGAVATLGLVTAVAGTGYTLAVIDQGPTSVCNDREHYLGSHTFNYVSQEVFLKDWIAAHPQG